MNDAGAPQNASEWLVALMEEPDDMLLKQHFSDWLAASSANEADWAEIRHMYDVMGKVVPIYQQHWADLTDASRAKVPVSRIAFKTQRLFMVSRLFVRARYGFATGAALAACLVIFLLPQLFLRMQADYATGTAVTRQITLPDGSVLHLAPQSAVSLAFTPQTRQVKLLKGEAFFEIVHDSSRPFSVDAGKVRTTDIGTAFEVARDGGETDISVREGMVEVSGIQDADTHRLGAGEWVRIGSTGVLGQGTARLAEIASWTHGQIIAQNQPTGAVVGQIQAYYHGFVFLRGASLAAQPITGVFNVNAPVEALKTIAQSQNARLSQPLPWVVVISGR